MSNTAGQNQWVTETVTFSQNIPNGNTSVRFLSNMALQAEGPHLRDGDAIMSFLLVKPIKMLQIKIWIPQHYVQY